MIRALALLLVCQLAGEVLSRATGLPVPGPVLGLVMLASGAIFYARVTKTDVSAIETTDLGRAATALIGALGLLFVPAGVGIVQQLPVVGAWGFALFVALLVSTLVTLLVTVYVFLFVKRLVSQEKPAP